MCQSHFKQYRGLTKFPLSLSETVSKPQNDTGKCVFRGRIDGKIKDPKLVGIDQHLFGIGSGGYRPVAYASNAHNEHEALKARVLLKTPVVDQHYTAKCINWLKDNHDSIFPRIHKVDSVSWETYLEKSNAAPGVKRTLDRIKKQMDGEGIDKESKLSSKQLYQYTTRKSFIKIENNNYRTWRGRKNKAPRLISGAQPQFTRLVGPWITSLQSRVKRRWDKSNFICFTSGNKSVDMANHLMSLNGRLLEDDIGTFDASVSKQWLLYEVWLCRRFGAPRAVLDLMRANINTHGATTHGWKYKVADTRKSGDPYTSLMNSIINGCMHIFLYHDFTGKTMEEIKKSIRMLVQGDDNALNHVEQNTFDWVSGMAKFGFSSEAIYRNDPNMLQFCSNRLIPVKGGWNFVPKVGKVLSKIGYFVNPPPNVDPISLVKGTALGLMVACSPNPILTSYLKRILHLCGDATPYASRFEDWKMNYSHTPPTEDTMLALEQVYGWDCQAQTLFEGDLDNVCLGDDLSSPLAERLYDIDSAGPRCIFSSVLLSLTA